jgi:hypothetical protein
MGAAVEGSLHRFDVVRIIFAATSNGSLDFKGPRHALGWLLCFGSIATTAAALAVVFFWFGMAFATAFAIAPASSTAFAVTRPAGSVLLTIAAASGLSFAIAATSGLAIGVAFAVVRGRGFLIFLALNFFPSAVGMPFCCAARPFSFGFLLLDPGDAERP